MKINSNQQDFIKLHQGMIRTIIQERMTDYFNQVVDEPDLQRKEVLSLMVKELRMVLTMVDNICNLKDKKKNDGDDFTGV